MKNNSNSSHFLGVAHHDDLMYIFYISKFPRFEKDDPEILTLERMTAIWENFARTGEPIPKNNSLFENVKWDSFTQNNKRYLQINNTLSMKNGLINPERMAIWDKLFPVPTLPSSLVHHHQEDSI